MTVITKADIGQWRDGFTQDHPDYYLAVHYADHAIRYGPDNEAWRIIETLIRIERGELDLRAFLFSVDARVPSQEIPVGREMMRLDRVPRRDRAVELVPGVFAGIMGMGQNILQGPSGEPEDYQVAEGAVIAVWDERFEADDLPVSLRKAAAQRTCGDPDCDEPAHQVSGIKPGHRLLL